MKPIDQMCKEAQEIIRLLTEKYGDATEKDADIGALIGEQPELAAGLNEFVEFREDHSAHVAKTDTASATPHSIKGALSGSGPPPSK